MSYHGQWELISNHIRSTKFLFLLELFKTQTKKKFHSGTRSALQNHVCVYKSENHQQIYHPWMSMSIRSHSDFFRPESNLDSPKLKTYYQTKQYNNGESMYNVLKRIATLESPY
jgi:hypothetical protein